MKKSLLLAFICASIDQVVKIILMNTMHVGMELKIIKNFFNITLVMNDGAAFSTFRSKTLFLVVISLVVIVSLLFYLKRGKNLKGAEYIIYGILLGGIIGNLIDRIIYSSVIDYLDFNFFGYSFPIFNFADICIVVSIALIALFTIKEGKNGGSSNKIDET